MFRPDRLLALAFLVGLGAALAGVHRHVSELNRDLVAAQTDLAVCNHINPGRCTLVKEWGRWMTRWTDEATGDTYTASIGMGVDTFRTSERAMAVGSAAYYGGGNLFIGARPCMPEDVGVDPVCTPVPTAPAAIDGGKVTEFQITGQGDGCRDEDIGVRPDCHRVPVPTSNVMTGNAMVCLGMDCPPTVITKTCKPDGLVLGTSRDKTCDPKDR